MEYCCRDFKDAWEDGYIWFEEQYSPEKEKMENVYCFGKEGVESVYQQGGLTISFCPFCGQQLKP